MQYDCTTLRPTTQDLTGQAFDRLTVLRFAGYRKRWLAYWTCVCQCGTVKDIIAGTLTHRTARSCGCLVRDTNRQRMTIHGHSGTPEYYTWKLMLARCEDPRTKGYRYYGARGITVCEAWHTFDNFFADMGPRPSPHHSIERLQSTEGYHAANCIWFPVHLQQRNTSRNRFLTYNNVTQCAAAWAEVTGIAGKTICARKNYGWSDEDALTIPVDRHRRHRH